ncbi:MAG: endonuclease/exonuclease/phosphatase family protein [Minicystis sp.]
MSLSRRAFLAAGALAGLGGLVSMRCRTAAPVFGTPAQREALEKLLLASAPRSTLSILSWNIFMMPSWLRDSPRNGPRAAAIAAELLAADYDILCFQKAFDPAARAVLRGLLSATHPYELGPANDGCAVEESSGVWVLSRVPLVNYAQIEFKECASVECLSRKGAMLLTGACGRLPFHLITTHLQGEEGTWYSEKNQRIRQLQMEQIRDQLLLPNVQPGVPVFLCGDFSTPHFQPKTATSAPAHLVTEVYRSMLSTFQAENGVELPNTLVDDLAVNDMARSNSGLTAEDAFVLVRRNERALSVTWKREVFRRAGWDAPTTRSDLAYRYAVGARIRFEDEGG